MKESSKDFEHRAELNVLCGENMTQHYIQSA